MKKAATHSKSKAELKKNLQNLRDRAVCIITARSGEAQGLAEALGIDHNILKGHAVWDVDNGFSFYLGSFDLEESHLDYYITSGRHMGVQSFAIDCGLLMHILRPRFIVHAGVCAGFKDNESTPLIKLVSCVLLS